MKRIFPVYLLVLLALWGCEKQLDYDLPPGSDHLVVNSILNAEADSVVVNISLSKPTAEPLDTNLFVNNARVAMYENDNFLFYLPWRGGKGYYFANYRVVNGARYKIVVDYKDKHATAQVTVPQRPDFTASILDTANGLIRGEVTLHDPDSTQDYYMIAVQFNRPVIVDTIFLPDTVIFQYAFLRRDILQFVIFDFGPVRSSLPGIMHGFAFTDYVFNGRDYTFRWYAVNPMMDTVFVQLYRINKDLYDFLESFSRMEMINNNPFAQPMNVYTNVDGGLGLVGALSYKEDTLIISEFLHP